MRKALKTYIKKNQKSLFSKSILAFRDLYFFALHQFYKYSLILRGFNVNDNFNPKYKSKKKIDVVFCVIERDLDTLRLSLNSIRNFLKHPINKIFIISPNSRKLRQFATENDCIFVDEQSFPFRKSQINYVIEINGKSIDRSGWLFQQFLGLSADLFCEQDSYLILDSDTILTKPQTFEYDGKYILNYGDRVHTPYFNIFEKIFGFKAKCPATLTCHMMLIDKEILSEMKNFLRNIHNKEWHEVVIDNIDPAQHSFHSDYESYGQFALNKYKENFILSYWYNDSKFRSSFDLHDNLKIKLNERTKSLSLHHYND